MKLLLPLLLLMVTVGTASPPAQPGQPRQWGNAVFVDLSVGESFEYQGKSVKLVAIADNTCTVSVDGIGEKLFVARRGLPTTINGVRVFVADNRPVANLTSDAMFPLIHASMTKDALLCLSDPAKPLLDPGKYVFPISRDDGFEWQMGENSHMFGYLRPQRAHEGIDIDLNEARGKELHPLVAIESGVVVWIEDGNPKESCILLESSNHPGIYYVYQHLNRDRVLVKAGQQVSKGERLAYIWGDGRWGHLHFSVIGYGEEPTFPERYRYLLNCFPQLYELWNGDTEMRPVTHLRGHFNFAGFYFTNGNIQRLNSYTDILGYGWELGDWCTAAKVERSVVGNEGMVPHQSAVVRKVMHRQTDEPATNPNDYCDFEIAVKNGSYRMGACVGNLYGPTWQEVFFEGEQVGAYDLKEGELAWTEQMEVKVNDGKLTVRLRFGDEANAAALREMYFTISDDN